MAEPTIEELISWTVESHEGLPVRYAGAAVIERLSAAGFAIVPRETMTAARHYIDGTRDDSGHKRRVLAAIDAEEMKRG